MGFESWLVAAHAFATMVMVGVIWTVQLVHYPLFALVGREGFVAYQRSHMRRITWIVGPMMGVELAGSLAIAVVGVAGVDAPIAWVGFGLVVLLWVMTAAVQGPTHVRLTRGYRDALVRRLVVSNWVRTAAWTARGGIALWMVAAHFGAIGAV